MQRLVTHILALIVGVVLTFGTLHVSSSQADPAPIALSPVENSGTLVAQRTLPSRGSFVTEAIAQTGPAVVRIDTARTVETRLPPMFEDPFFREFFGDRVPGGQAPQERRVSGQGSGFIIDTNGIVLTNAHVVSGADEVNVTLQDGREFEATVLGSDPVTDLAVVKIKGASNLPVTPLGDSDRMQVGDWAIAVGSPGGLNNTVTLGIISTLDRPSSQIGIPDKRLNFIQTDAAINPGNSGGPLLNANGEAIGINTAIRANATGIGFAIPINKAKELKDILAAGKEVPHPYVGIEMRDITPELAKRSNENPNSTFTIPEVEGVLIWRILPDTPAARSGLRRGDIIVEIDGKGVKSGLEIQNIVDKSRIGQSLTFKVRRGNDSLNIAVKPAQLQNR